MTHPPLPPRPGVVCPDPLAEGDSALQDLDWYDGPLASIHRARDGGLFLVSWLDSDTNRWRCVRMTPEQLEELAAGRLSRGQLWNAPPDGHVYVWDSNVDQWSRATPGDFPPAEDLDPDEGRGHWHEPYYRGQALRVRATGELVTAVRCWEYPLVTYLTAEGVEVSVNDWQLLEPLP